jgi:hypothetical protein
MADMSAEMKAELLAIGSVDVDRTLLPGQSMSTAGPGTGLQSVFFKSGRHRVRLEIKKDSPLKMVRVDGEFAILREGKELIRGKYFHPVSSSFKEIGFDRTC